MGVSSRNTPRNRFGIQNNLTTNKMKFYFAYKKLEKTVSPQFEVRKNKVYPTVQNKNLGSRGRALPWYEIKKGRLYSTTFHPEGRKTMPLYEIRNDKVHTTVFHPKPNIKPVFTIKQ